MEDASRSWHWLNQFDLYIFIKANPTLFQHTDAVTAHMPRIGGAHATHTLGLTVPGGEG
jgi:hypothetical protein